MRQRIFSIIAAFLLLATVLGSASAAQEATPASGLADLGLPELNITVNATSYEGIPEQLEAGRYLVNVTATEDTAAYEGGGVGFIQPAEVSAEEFLAALAGPPDVTGTGATPIADAATPVAEEEGGEVLPPFIFASTFAGGTYAAPGGTAQIVLDLAPGEWIAWGDNPEAPWEPVIFEATGEMPAELPEPESSATFTLGEYIIEVSEGELTAGPQVIRIDNIGAQPHFVVASRSSVPVTGADLEALLEADMTGTPAAVDINPDEDFEDAFYSGTQSNGTSVWIPVDLEPGTYVLLCFFPDISDGMPHAYHGMYNIVEVGE